MASSQSERKWTIKDPTAGATSQQFWGIGKRVAGLVGAAQKGKASEFIGALEQGRVVVTITKAKTQKKSSKV